MVNTHYYMNSGVEWHIWQKKITRVGWTQQFYDK